MALCGWLQQSTAVTVMLGPFVDEGDGKTAETGLTITHDEVRLSKNGGNMAEKHEGANCSHDEIGIYGCPLDTTDTNTLGILTVMVHESGALPIRQDYLVMKVDCYNMALLGSDKWNVNIAEVNGVAVEAGAGRMHVFNHNGDPITTAGPTKAEMDAAHALLATPAQVNVQVKDVLETDTHAESAAAPAATASLKDKIVWLATLGRNKIKQTATTQTLRNDADGGDIATADVSDDGTTAIRNEWT